MLLRHYHRPACKCKAFTVHLFHSSFKSSSSFEACIGQNFPTGRQYPPLVRSIVSCPVLYILTAWFSGMKKSFDPSRESGRMTAIGGRLLCLDISASKQLIQQPCGPAHGFEGHFVLALGTDAALNRIRMCEQAPASAASPCMRELCLRELVNAS